jgi:hypothetical protein
VSLGGGSFSFLSQNPKKRDKVRMAKEQGIPEINAHPKVLQLGAKNGLSITHFREDLVD